MFNFNHNPIRFEEYQQSKQQLTFKGYTGTWLLASYFTAWKVRTSACLVVKWKHQQIAPLWKKNNHNGSEDG